MQRLVVGAHELVRLILVMDELRECVRHVDADTALLGPVNEPSVSHALLEQAARLIREVAVHERQLHVSNAPLEIGKHTAELQSQSKLVCRLLPKKKKQRGRLSCANTGMY